MSKDLYAENQHLRRQLRAFIAQARSNEQKMYRFQSQELRLISTNSLAEFLKMVVYNYRTTFELDAVTLVLVDPDFEIQHILEDEGVRLADHTGLVFSESTDQLDALFGPSGLPWLGRFTAERHGELFGAPAAALASVACLPLIRYGELIGSLNLGSGSDERFISGSGTYFLERLAAIVAICIENATNHERLKRVGLTDFLTAVNNRRFFDQRLTEEITRAGRHGAPLSCLLLDLDDFKAVNDRYGHQAGDRVLKEVARLIRTQLRCSDVLARYGGEEFAALLIGADGALAVEIAERIRASVAGHVMPLEHTAGLRVTLSIGVATLQGREGAPRDAAAIGEQLVDQADQGLYASKHRGKNQVMCVGTPADEVASCAPGSS